MEKPSSVIFLLTPKVMMVIMVMSVCIYSGIHGFSFWIFKLRCPLFRQRENLVLSPGTSLHQYIQSQTGIRVL